jgi:hypothetical protein
MFRAAMPLLLFLIASVVAAQTMGDLSARYGYPDAERFVARPGMTMLASYAEDRTACEMLIEPKHSIRQSNDKEQSMATDNVMKIIDELIPKSERGILLNHIIENMGAGEYQVAEYQNVTIERYFVRYLPANRDEKRATIVRKDGMCRSATAPQEYVPAIKLTATDLHTQYGDPDAERFIVRPGITLMVAYDTDHSACQMVVEPTRSISPRDKSAKYMRPEVVTEILDEVLPEADRGKLLLDTITKSGCNDFQIADYQNVTVSHSIHKCRLPNPDIEGTATVTRKNSSCGNSAN